MIGLFCVGSSGESGKLLSSSPRGCGLAVLRGLFWSAGNATVATEKQCSVAFFTSLLGSKYLIYAETYRGRGLCGGVLRFLGFDWCFLYGFLFAKIVYRRGMGWGVVGERWFRLLNGPC
jgi:hypothetical protein